MQKVFFLLFFKGVSTLEAYISETIWATDFWLVSMATAWKVFFYKLSSKVRKCHFSLKGALTKPTGHFWAVFQGGVNFGSPYLRNRFRYTLLVGLNGSNRKKYFYYQLSSKVKKCHFSLKGAFTNAKGPLFFVFQEDVIFGSPYFENCLS